MLFEDLEVNGMELSDFDDFVEESFDVADMEKALSLGLLHKRGPRYKGLVEAFCSGILGEVEWWMDREGS